MKLNQYLINPPFVQDPSLKFFLSQRYNLKIFRKLINTVIIDKDQIKRRNTQPFYTCSLSITREANPVI